MQPEPTARTPGYVYVVTDGTAYKIGWTIKEDVALRVATLQNGNPRPLTVVGAIPAASIAAETALHKAVAAGRLNGEWFDLPPNIVRMICAAPSADAAAETVRRRNPRATERWVHHRIAEREAQAEELRQVADVRQRGNELDAREADLDLREFLLEIREHAA